MKKFVLSDTTSLWLVAVITITVMAFTACSKKSETQSQTATAEQTQAASSSAPSNPHPEILTGDLSAFAGIWVNGEGIKQEVRADGTVYKEGSNDARAASGFQRLDNDSYYWLVSILNYEGMGRGAFNAQLYPVGVEVMGGNGKILTDTSKARMFYPEVDVAYRSDEIYYRVGEAASQSKVREPAELTGEWHSRSITDSCHGQEHYIFTADGYYKKGDLYQKHDGTWSLSIDARGKYNLTLQYKQFIDFESGWTPNDFTEYSEYETIDPNNIDLLIHGTGWIELTRCHNPGWNAQ